MSRALVVGATLAIFAMGCIPPAIDLANRRCPCTTGWTCDTARDRCVLGAVSDAALGIDASMGMDSGRDAAATPDSGSDAFVAMSDVGLDAASSPDSGPDAGHDGGMPGDTACTGALAAALVCDGFETDPGPWTGRNEHLGTVVTDGLQAVRGNRALHATTTAGGGQGSRAIDGLGPFTSGDLWVRISVLLPSGAPVTDMTWFSIGEVVPPYAGISLGAGSSLAIGSYSSISMDYVSSSAVTIARDTWTCLELHVVISDTAGAIEVYRDGVLGASRSGIDTKPGAGFARWSVGIDYTSPPQAPIEVWLDEVALSRVRLACP